MKNVIVEIVKSFILGQIVFFVGCSTMPDIEVTFKSKESDSQPTIIQSVSMAKEYDEIKESIVEISSGRDGNKKHGTGFVVEYDGKKYIATVSHVLQGGDENPRVSFNKDNIVKAKIIHQQSSDDGLAILSVEEMSQEILPLIRSESVNLEKREGSLFTLGFPQGSPFLGPAYERLNYSGKAGGNENEKDKQRKGQLVFSNSAYSENYADGISGSPIVKENEVIGIITDIERHYLYANPVRDLNGYLLDLFGKSEENSSAQQTSSDQSATERPLHCSHDALKKGGMGPKIIMIKGGKFQIGDNYKVKKKDDDIEELREVVVKDFMIGCYEISFNEYDRFAEDTGRKKPNDNGWGRGDLPVINVSWYDANEYAKWLSKQTGQKYRLPTDQEWEYAARGGTTTKYWWGDNAYEKKANCSECTDDWIGKTKLVNSYSQNQFGLYNILGNVREWTCSIRDYNKTCPGEDIPRSRTFRGGSYRNDVLYLRASNRGFDEREYYTHDLGFRVVKELGSDTQE